MCVLSCRTWAPVQHTKPTQINPPKAAGDSRPTFILLSNNGDFAVNTSVNIGSYQFLKLTPPSYTHTHSFLTGTTQVIKEITPPTL